MNQFVIVGRIFGEPRRVVIEEENNKKVVLITIANQRVFKNDKGEYETDLITFKVFDSLGENAIEYCKQGDLIGVKGRVESNGDRVELVVEKITFLSNTNRG